MNETLVRFLQGIFDSIMDEKEPDCNQDTEIDILLSEIERLNEFITETGSMLEDAIEMAKQG